MITIHMTASSKVGCVRTQNEDMVLVGNRFVRNDSYRTRVDLTNSDRFIVAVADGMGGHVYCYHLAINYILFYNYLKTNISYTKDITMTEI